MKSQSYSRFFQPLYVLIAGAVGGGIVVYWFFYHFPLPEDAAGKAFAAQFSFWVWVFLIVVTMCIAVIFLLPAWGMFFWLFNKQVLSLDRHGRNLEISKLVLSSIFLLLIVLIIIQLSKTSSVGVTISYPMYHSQRITIMWMIALLVFLPIAMGMFLTYKASQDLIVKIQAAARSEEQLFPFTHDLLTYRSILQTSLVMVAVLLSMNPINTFALRTAVIAVYPGLEQKFPAAAVVVYGLAFTLVLLLIYLPTHFALTEASQKLRDALYPVEKLDDLDNTLSRRKQLDILLQTNTGLLDNIKSGIVTFAPLITSLLVAMGIQLK